MPATGSRFRKYLTIFKRYIIYLAQTLTWHKRFVLYVNSFPVKHNMNFAGMNKALFLWHSF